MPHANAERLRSIKTLPQLTAYLRDELDWPIEQGDAEDITFEYQPHELGIDEKAAVRIKEIKQLRPLASNQPWGIFFINFEKKRLPVVVMRLILRALILKKRASSNKSDRQAWLPHDLLFISAYGEDTDRAITFAHFVENPGNSLAELRVLGWDDDDTPLHMDYVSTMIHSKLRWDDSLTKDPDTWREKWSEAFVIRHQHVIRTSEELAAALAGLAGKIRSRIRTILRSEDGFGEIRKLQRAFKDGLIHDLNDDNFADMFAQTVTYGLFSIACRRTIPGAGTAVVKDDYEHYFTSPFLKEMLGIFLGVKSRKGKIDFDQLGVSDVTDLLNSPDTHMEVVLADFNNKTRGEDPVIHFYEHFLSAYNKQLKIQRGVFYTPQPVVSYIVRSVHELLQTEFGLEHGLADTTTWGEMLKKHSSLKLPPLTDEDACKETISPDEFFVQILDPATGTATFPVEVIGLIYNDLKALWEKRDPAAMPTIPLPENCKLNTENFAAWWNCYVPHALLPRLHAFELMMAPYAIAHMKVGLKLAETGYRFGTEERARIYLTNALEPWVKQLPLIGFEALAHEAAAVNEIKRHKRFTVVIGNPPYAVAGFNKNQWIDSLMGLYKKEVSDEFNIQLLSDDYAKFIRYADWAVSVTGFGIVGLITKNTYINTTAFRGLRKCLQTGYQCVSILDLHGKLYETTPQGTPNTNVFDIRVGVAIAFLSKGIQPNKTDSFRHFELNALAEEKLDFVARNAYSTTPWSDCPIDRTRWIFEPLASGDAQDEYANYTPLLDLAISDNGEQGECWGGGVKTNRDYLLVAFSRSELDTRLEMLSDCSLPISTVKENLGLKDGDYWNTERERRKLSSIDWRARVFPYFYGPFDIRYVAHIPQLIEIGRGGASKHLMVHYQALKNRGLVLKRRNLDSEYHHVFATSCTVDINALSGQTYTIPLKLAGDAGDSLFVDSSDKSRVPNFNAGLKRFTKLLGNAANIHEEEVFNYTYAILHSPYYRLRYQGELQKDFPRLPLTGNLELFRALARLGGELTALHLLESPKLAQPITEFIGSSKEVTKVGYSDHTVWINASGTRGNTTAGTSGFRGVPETVWNFHIGGYQVCEKWLKDRKGRTLTDEDIAHYHKIVISLSETIRLMAEIDNVIDKHGGWPGAFSVTDSRKESDNEK